METPRLSPSIAKILLDKSPKHAWQAHRLLGGGNGGEKTQSLKLGSAADVAVFGVEQKDDGKKKRKAPKRDATAKAIADAVNVELERRGITGEAQHRVEWRSYGVECSGVLDLFDSNVGKFWDLKTGNDLSDEKINWAIDKYRYDLQIAAYLEAIGGIGTPAFIFVESAPPYDVRFVPVTGAVLAKGTADWRRAVNKWRKCMDSNEWPGRGDFTADVSGWRKKQDADKWLSDGDIE